MEPGMSYHGLFKAYSVISDLHFFTSVCTLCCPSLSFYCLYALCRYYMIAEYANGGEQISSFLDGIRLDEATTRERQIEEGDYERQSPLDSKNEVYGGDIDVEADQRSSCALDQEKDMCSGARQCLTQEKDPRTDYAEKLCLSLPPMISRQYPTSPRKIEEFILSRSDISLKDRDILKVPISALSAWWAPKRLSIVGKHCRRSYCFTHSYGRLYDMSSGSLFYEVPHYIWELYLLLHLFSSSFFHLMRPCCFRYMNSMIGGSGTSQ